MVYIYISYYTTYNLVDVRIIVDEIMRDIGVVNLCQQSVSTLIAEWQQSVNMRPQCVSSVSAGRSSEAAVCQHNGSSVATVCQLSVSSVVAVYQQVTVVWRQCVSSVSAVCQHYYNLAPHIALPSIHLAHSSQFIQRVLSVDCTHTAPCLIIMFRYVHVCVCFVLNLRVYA